MIKNLELEKKVLSGLLQHQDLWEQAANLLTEDDFYAVDTQVHVSIFKLIRAALNNAEILDETILIGRLLALGTSFADNIDLPEYIRSLAYHKVTVGVFLASVKEIKKTTLRRKIYDSTLKMQTYVKKVDMSTPYVKMLEGADKIHNDTIQDFEGGENTIVDLSQKAESLIEGIANNPPKEIGIMSPYPTINKIYGSMFRGGNITCIGARAKVGKTTIILDCALKTSYSAGVPILHFDNGEMSEDELIFRMVSGMSGIPQYMLEDGSWRHRSYGEMSVEMVIDKVRSVWSKIQKTKVLYENVAGLTSEEMCSLLKRRYYSEVGRGNPMIFSFDYLKSDFNNLGSGDNWAFVGKTLHDMKQTISKDLKFDGKPTVAMLTSVQLNRLGITTNRNAQTVQETESESAIGLSDHIIQFVSHFFLLRKKTIDERGMWGERFGTHNLINLAARHLGEDMWAHLNPIEVPNEQARQNFINMEFSNFNVEDRGDLRDIVNYLQNGDVAARVTEDRDLPTVLA